MSYETKEAIKSATIFAAATFVFLTVAPFAVFGLMRWIGTVGSIMGVWP